jgi:hypothetical protein
MKNRGNRSLWVTFILATAVLFLAAATSKAAAYTSATNLSIQTTTGTTYLDLSKGSGSNVQFVNGKLVLAPGKTNGYFVLNPVSIAPNSLRSVSGMEGGPRVSYIFSANGVTWYAFDTWDYSWTTLPLSGTSYGNDPDNNVSEEPWPLSEISSTDWNWLIKTTGKLYVAVLLYGTSPPPSSIAPPTVTLSGPSTILAGTSATLQATVTSSITPVVEKWTLPDGTTKSGSSVTYTSKVSDGNTLTFKFTAYLSAYPSYTTTKTFTVTNVTKPQNLTMSGPGTALMGDTKTYTASATTRIGTVAYTFTLPDGSTVNSSTANYKFTPSYGGTISVKAYIAGYPSLSDTKSMNVAVTYPSPTITSVTCPSSVLGGVPFTCSVSASAPVGTLKYQWSVDGGGSVVSTSGNSASINLTTSGIHSIGVKAYLQEDSTAYDSDTARVTVTAPTVTISDISGPGSLLMDNPTGSYSFTGSTDLGAIAYDLTIAKEGTTVFNGAVNSKTFTFTESGTYTVTAKAYVIESPSYYKTRSLTVTVKYQSPTISSISCPSSALGGVPNGANLR